MFCCKLGFFGCLCPTFARAELETLTRDLDSEDCDCARVEAAYARVRSLSRSLRVSVCLTLAYLFLSPPLPAQWAAAGAGNKHATLLLKIQGREKKERVQSETQSTGQLPLS